jgi:hypothetical protein
MRLPAPWCARSGLLAFLLATAACRLEDIRLPGDAGAGDSVGDRVGDAAPDNPPVVKSGSSSLPQAAGQSMAVWIGSGGGATVAMNGAVAVTISCLAGTSTVAAPSGAQITLGHFVDTLE